MTHDLDLLIIGAGSGGVACSRRAALHGARVAVVEGGRVGGTCVIRGCVPKKLLMYAAQYGDAFAEARGYGWTVAPPRFEMARWAAAKAAETARLEGVYRQMLASGGVELIEGWASLDGPHRVRVDGKVDGKARGKADGKTGARLITARHIVLATGAMPVRDSIPGIEACATSDDLLDLAALPERAAVIGSGYIAVEFASMLARLGVAVSMFYRGTLPLRGFDDMLREASAAALQAAGVALHPASVMRGVQPSAAGLRLLHDGPGEADFPWVLNATGRRPNSAALGLASVGLQPNRAGAVVVDGQLHTGVEGLHAIGDLTDRKNLTPVAIAEGRALADSLFGGEARQVDLSLVASAVFMLPPIASIGPSESEAAAAGRKVRVYETAFRPMRQAFVGGQERSQMKLLVDDTSDRVLAVHMVGGDAPEIVQSLAVALSAAATKADFDRTVAVHPTAAEEFVLLRKLARSIGGPVGLTSTGPA